MEPSDTTTKGGKCLKSSSATYFPTCILSRAIRTHGVRARNSRGLDERRGWNAFFFPRIGEALAQVSRIAYDVAVIDCPPQLGFLTLSALCAATAVLITVHPQMLDVMSMSQFLNMTGSLLDVVAEAGGTHNTIGCDISLRVTSRVTGHRSQWLVLCARSSDPVC